MSLLHPLSVAVAGASADEKKVGHYVLHNLLTQGFKGAIYPVNPKQTEILGKKAYPSVSDIPGPVDIVVVVTPAATVPAIAEECGKKKVGTLVVITAGFGETGTPEGKKMEEDLVAIARAYGMALVGPNCLGVLRPSAGMNASFAENVRRPGNVALLSQSGAMAVALMDSAAELSLAFSLVVSMGNKAAMDECDFLAMCAQDHETRVVGLYLESIRDGRRFLEIASGVCRTKPVVLIKSGVSERGKHAVSSHTGALAGSDAAIDAACLQAGIRRAQTTEQFMDMLRVLSSQPPLLSPQIAVVTNAGGPGILATDAAEREGLTLLPLRNHNRESLKQALPPAASIQNPIDVLGDALAERYAAALAACVADANIDGIAVLLTPQVMTPESEIAAAIVETMRRRPLMPVVTSFMGEKNVRQAAAELGEKGIPNFQTPERAIAALAALRIPKSEVRDSGFRIQDSGFDRSRAQSIVQNANGLLSEDKTHELFSLYALPLPSSMVAKSADAAAAVAASIGYPVVAKISSPQILHKTDMGGVRVNLRTEAEVRAAFAEVSANAAKHMPDASIDGVLIQRFLPAGSEFIVGALRDDSFGHLVMAGLGGIYTELFRDTAFRISPIGSETAYDMLQSLRGWKLLLGMRGKKSMAIDALAELIVNVSRLVHDCPMIKELDLNPVLVWENEIAIADAKVVLG